jgi:hypothetical protein
LYATQRFASKRQTVIVTVLRQRQLFFGDSGEIPSAAEGASSKVPGK